MKEMEKKLLSDFAKIYEFLNKSNKDTQLLYELVQSSEIPHFLTKVYNKLPQNDEVLFALIDRVVTLRESALDNVMDKYNIQSPQEIKDEMFFISEQYYKNKFINLLLYINDNALLTDFWRELLNLVYELGLCFNRFFYSWQKELILGINTHLKEKHNNNLQSILEALQDSIEISDNGEVSDRSYSVPMFIDGKYRAVSYCEFFKEEFKLINQSLESGILKLKNIKETCSKLEQKDRYLDYFGALQKALMQKDTKKLLESWRDVDVKWLGITTPIQVCHPFEYYEDHFRKAVAPEWDLRIARCYNGIDLLNDSSDSEVNSKSMWVFYSNFFAEFVGLKYTDEINLCVNNSLQKTQLYGGLPMMFFGSELNGLFSAQVIPNDEVVSKKHGKKIFYFPDRILEMSRAKPFMLLSSLTFPREFLDFNRELLFFREKEWYKIYEISTIGHEFGHILCVSDDSELVMNKSGNFKNIEEFKATMGGLAYYFTRQNRPLLKELIYSLIARSVSLIAWRDNGEVLPYYCEGLIHLSILFTSGVLKYKNKFSNNKDSCALSIDLKFTDTLIELYLQVYKDLARIYFDKQDADVFLSQYVAVGDGGYYEPILGEVAEFAYDYYNEYKKIGQVLDNTNAQEWCENYKNSCIKG
ncbi:invasion protein CiaB [Helicobacter sp. WB40]|uniref:invasion protein CiaB n=1 Tax=Helicobacter sp. WB40 TaxID=3004130 RepID=UPI0022EBE50C|nr:invasion protein CiaB [Helicobacter sp. WB40]MDA3966568.1 invasion protein CiaB [Helicobacter sp. WB40]